LSAAILQPGAEQEEWMGMRRTQKTRRSGAFDEWAVLGSNQ
jgi:hypothetical protein